MNDKEILKLTKDRDLAAETWNFILKEIKPRISQVSFETWLLPCIPLTLTVENVRKKVSRVAKYNWKADIFYSY